MIGLVEEIERDIRPIEVAVFNIGATCAFNPRDDEPRLSKGVGDGLLRRFPHGPGGVAADGGGADAGTIIFTGATASMRGGSGFAAFAGAKFALAGAGAEHGARTGSEGRSCRAFDHRRRDRHGLHPRQFSGALQAPGPRTASLDPDAIADAYWGSTRSRAAPGHTIRSASVDGNVLTRIRAFPRA